MKLRGALTISVLVLAACTATPGGGASPGERIANLFAQDPDEAAQKSLEAFKGLVTADDFAPLGFESLDEVGDAKLGEPIPVSSVPLDQLKEYTDQTDPEELLHDAGRIIYPVTVGDAVRCSVDIGQIDDGWEGTTFGSPALIRPIAELRTDPSEFVVWVPALNMYFVASRADGLQLTPAFDYPAAELVSGRTLSANEVFSAISPLAKAQEDLPT